MKDVKCGCDGVEHLQKQDFDARGQLAPQVWKMAEEKKWLL